VSYQINWMYLRYFMWNFVGRENDIQGNGEPTNGHWISGIPFIDQWVTGVPQRNLPERMKDNKGRNTYFFLPLIVGIIGLLYHSRQDKRGAMVVTMLFLLTGLAIVVYLNQTPQQPRERDYAYAGSFYAFAIWIGLGVYALFDVARSITTKELQRVASITLGAGAMFFILEFIGDSHALSYTLLYMGIVALAAIFAMHFLGKAVKSSVIAAVVACLI